MGHGEDPPQREQTERTPDRDTGEGEDVFALSVCMCVICLSQGCADVLMFKFKDVVTLPVMHLR